MTTATERICKVCGVSIEGRRPQATTCSDACKQAKHRGTSSRPGSCRSCGRDLEPGRLHRWHCSRACALEPKVSAREPDRIGLPPQEECDHGLTLSALKASAREQDRATALAMFRDWLTSVTFDPDGQPMCLICGRPKGPSPKVNGFNTMRAHMETDADGQYRHPPRCLGYTDLGHLRTRTTASSFALPRARARNCASCGDYLPSGQRGPVCDRCGEGAS